MAVVTWKDLRYQREQDYFEELRPTVEKLENESNSYMAHALEHESRFYRFMSHAVKIDQLPSISKLIKWINHRLGTDLRVSVFVFQSSMAEAMCMPRGMRLKDDGEGGKVKDDELVILLSQHFVNDLGPGEQSSILGHEIGHLALGHLKVPKGAILDADLNLETFEDTKAKVLKWSTCAEVSCDILGFVSCNNHVTSFSSAMLKYTTGLTGDVLGTLDPEENLMEMILQQYDDLTKSVIDSSMSTHPLTPLRLKIIRSIADNPLFYHFGKEMDDLQMTAAKAQLNDAIDAHLGEIYPEIVSSGDHTDDISLFYLALAVSLADGEITKDEIEAIQKILGSNQDVQAAYEHVQQMLETRSVEEIIREYIQIGTDEAERVGCKRVGILSKIRQLLVIADSDGKIEKAELQTIFDFAGQYGVTKQELVLMMEQMRK